MSFPISPGVYPLEVDLSTQPAPFPTSIGACTFASLKGPTVPTFVSSTQQFIQLYGAPNPTISYGHDSCLAFLQQSSLLWCQRVVPPDSEYAGGYYANNWLSNGVYEGTSYTPLPGSYVDYENDDRDIQEIVFSADIVSGNAINLKINGSSISTVNYASSNNNTLRLLAQAIQGQLDGIAAGGSARVIDRVNTNYLSNQRIVRIVCPQDTAISITNVAVTSGSSQATATVREAEWLFKVLAENQGVWGNNIATSISNIDPGTSQVVTLTFDGPFAVGQTFDGTVNGVEFGPVNFSTDNNGTLTAIANALRTALSGSTVTVLTVSGAEENRQIQITAPNPSTPIVLDNLDTNGSGSPPNPTWAVTLNQRASTNTFMFKVYNTALSTPVEQWTVALFDQVDGSNNQQNLAQNTNIGPNPSNYITTIINPLLSTSQLVPQSSFTPTLTGNLGFLAGGSDGSSVTSAEIINGWQSFANPEDVSVRILINAGYSTVEVQQAMIAIAEARKDCFCVLDMPTNYQSSAQDCINYRQNLMNIDSSYGAIYSPDVQFFDSYNGTARYQPPSGLVAAQYAYTDQVSQTWFAPAGLNRGLIKAALGLRAKYDEGDRDVMAQAQINPIYKRGARFPIWGEFTLQVATSDLSSVAVRRLLIVIETSLADYCALSVFEPNDPFTRYNLVQGCNNFLQPIEDQRGLATDANGPGFLVICDRTNNPPNIVDLRQLFVTVLLHPTLSALYIRLEAVLVKGSASFTETIQANNGSAIFTQ